MCYFWFWILIPQNPREKWSPPWDNLSTKFQTWTNRSYAVDYPDFRVTDHQVDWLIIDVLSTSGGWFLRFSFKIQFCHGDPSLELQLLLCFLSLSSAGNGVFPSETVGNSPHFLHLVVARFCLHEGHEEWELSHVSMHPTWNPCPHCGSTRISSPSAYSARQITQSLEDNFPQFPHPLSSLSELYVNVGNVWIVFFFIPLFGTRWLGLRLLLSTESRRSHAHRATAMRPATQIKAQRRAARMTTKSDSTATGSGGSAIVIGLSTVVRNLYGRVIVPSTGELVGGLCKGVWEIKK